MRIAFVSEHASPLATVLGGEDAGGQNVFVAELAAALAGHGHTVTVHTRRDRADVPRWVTMRPGVRVEHVPAGPPEPISKDRMLPYMGEFADQLRRTWRRHEPDVVHAHFWMSGRAALEARPPGTPLVQTFHALGAVKRRHQGREDSSPRERIDAEAAIIAAADRIVATCSDELFELVRLGADSGRVAIVPCGVALDRFHPAPAGGPAPRRAMRRGHRVAVVSRLVPRKGVGTVISALRDVPEALAIVAGGPSPDRLPQDAEYARFRRLADAEGVLDRVEFLGGTERSAVPALLRSADVVACVPWYEPFGMVALEAAACGVPVVASAVGGLVDTVVDGVTGLHVPPRRPDQLASALRFLLERPDLRAEMGRAGAERARDRYGWDAIAAQMAAVYEDVLGRRPAVARGRR